MRWSRDLVRILTPDVGRGMRAALVTLGPFYLAHVLARPELGWTALGGWLGTLVDPGGPRSTRAKVLVAFGVAGAPLVASFEAVARWPAVAAAGLMAVAFGMSLFRAIGGGAGVLGTYLTMIAAIGSARARTSPGVDGAAFGLGAAMALFVSSIVWPVWTHFPVRRAVAAVYDALAAYLDDSTRAAASGAAASPGAFSQLVRVHPRCVRDALERARAMALAGRARRQGETRFGGSIRALIGTAEIAFPLVSSLVLELESSAEARMSVDTARVQHVASTCRSISAALRTRDMRRTWDRLESPRASARPASSLSDRLLDRLDRTGALAGDLVDTLAYGREEGAAPHSHPCGSLAPKPGDPGLSLPPEPQATRTQRLSPPPARVEAAARALRDALSWRSALFQHALRTGAAAGLAFAAGMLLSRARVYWVTLTTLAILQPYPGATVKRAGERVVGTILGCVVALAITATVRSPVALSVLLVPLSVAAVATRPRSYRLFTLFLTPVFVLITDSTHDWRTAAQRAGDAVAGGAIALLVGVFVAPLSERRLVPEALDDALSALAAYGTAVFAAVDDDRARAGERVAAMRRAAGIAIGAAETSLERWLAEPLTDRRFAADAVLLMTYVRRLGTALTAFSLAHATHDARSPPAITGLELVRSVASYVGEAIEAARAHVAGSVPATTLATSPPGGEPNASALDPPLERVVRWAALVASVARPS